MPVVVMVVPVPIDAAVVGKPIKLVRAVAPSTLVAARPNKERNKGRNQKDQAAERHDRCTHVRPVKLRREAASA